MPCVFVNVAACTYEVEPPLRAKSDEDVKGRKARHPPRGPAPILRWRVAMKHQTNVESLEDVWIKEGLSRLSLDETNCASMDGKGR